MRLCERRCEACVDRAADGEPSAHFARVVWLCVEHSRQFHEAHHLARLRTMSTRDALSAIDAWLEFARAVDRMFGGKTLRAVTRPSEMIVIARHRT